MKKSGFGHFGMNGHEGIGIQPDMFAQMAAPAPPSLSQQLLSQIGDPSRLPDDAKMALVHQIFEALVMLHPAPLEVLLLARDATNPQSGGLIAEQRTNLSRFATLMIRQALRRGPIDEADRAAIASELNLVPGATDEQYERATLDRANLQMALMRMCAFSTEQGVAIAKRAIEGVQTGASMSDTLCDRFAKLREAMGDSRGLPSDYKAGMSHAINILTGDDDE